ncbi:MAG: CARDB domain-containing protein, partial [Candidatus Thermoplasmatota archaeon]
NAEQYGRTWDEDGSVPWYAYEESGQWYQCWYDDEESLEMKWEYVRDEGFAGTGFWALGYETAETWDILGNVFSSGQVFSQTAKEITVTMNSDKVVTANFTEVEEHILTIDVEGEGTTDPSPGAHEYEKGANVTVSAEAETGWKFSHWEGDVENVDNTSSSQTTVTMLDNYTITAKFEEVEYELVIDAEGGGTTSPAPDTYNYSEGEDVTIEALPEEDWRFSHWEGDVLEGEEENDEITMMMNGDKEVTALFLREPFFKVNIVGYDKEVTKGEVVEIEYRVTNRGDVEGTQTIEFTVDGGLEDSEELTLSPGEDHKDEFTWQPEKEGEFELEVISYDDEEVESTDQVNVSVIEEEPEDEGWSYWWLVLVVLIIVGVILTLLLSGNKLEKNNEKLEAEESSEENSLDEENDSEFEG